MEDYQVSLNGLLDRCQDIFSVDIKKCLLFFSAPPQAKLHYVKRLLILSEGELPIRYSENGKIIDTILSEPAIIYSSDKSFFWTKLLTGKPSVCFSFSYFPKFIRGMVIDYDGINRPTTARDIYYHTEQPLSPAGMQLLDILEKLHHDNQDAIAGELLMPLLKLTIEDMKKEHFRDKVIHSPSRTWARICYLLQTHCHEAISRSQLAKILRITPEYVSNLCKTHSGKSFSELKLAYQLEYAEKQLNNTDLNIEEIALNCGFNSSNYFIRRFKKSRGITPNAYRNQQTCE